VLQVTSSSTLLVRLPSKPELNPRGQCNYVILRRGLEGSESVTFEKGGVVNKAVSKEQNDELETITFGEGVV